MNYQFPITTKVALIGMLYLHSCVPQEVYICLLYLNRATPVHEHDLYNVFVDSLQDLRANYGAKENSSKTSM